MAQAAKAKPSAASTSIAIADVVALIGSLVIVIAYAALQFRSDVSVTGLGFIESSTTFPALTLVVGVVGVLSALVSLTALRERGARWWFVTLGALGLIVALDNTLRGRAGFALGGTLAMLGSAVLILQAFLPRPGYTQTERVSDTAFGILRVLMATLWFTQLLWKLPWNNYGCPPGPLVAAANTSGLCDWIGREIVEPRWAIYKDFLTNIVAPNLNWMAFFILAGEAFIAFSLMFGLFTRLGGLAGMLMGINLFIGLTAIPIEWDWTYLMLPAMNALFIFTGGRWIGLDAILNPFLGRLADRGNILARLAKMFT